MKKRIAYITLTVILTLLCFLGGFVLSFFTGYHIYYDVRYGTQQDNFMDVYMPRSAKKNGCVLFIHGGSWSGGDKSEEDLRCRLVANAGYVAVTINYTLYHDNTNYHVNTVLDEIDKALSFVKLFAETKGVSLTKTATSGYSAGAHLSMLYAFSRGEDAPLPIAFTANLAGPADLSVDVWGDTATFLAERLSGKKITEEMKNNGELTTLLQTLSPVTYVNRRTPPSLFVYGGKDTTVPIANGESVKRAFDACGAPYQYFFLPNATHSLTRNLGKQGVYYQTLLYYCKTYF